MAPKKKVLAVVKIQLEAGSATPAPPVGTALGPHGVQTMEFCKQYNAATESMRGTVVPVDITIYEDRTFSFVLEHAHPRPVATGGRVKAHFFLIKFRHAVQHRRQRAALDSPTSIMSSASSGITRQRARP